jgi:hypothetical protein
MRLFWLLILIFILNFGVATPLLAQPAERLTLSITPPLIKNNINPGQIWQGAIKLVNNNPAPITVYVEAVDFRGGEETGTVEFIQISKELQNASSSAYASTWMVIDTSPINIEPFASQELPFIVDVPETADPGGHYVALLAGTRPPELAESGSSIKVSSLLASLLLLNVSGDIKEKGNIREFSTSKSVYGEANVQFNVRFSNQGNVHIQPQGSIKIINPYNEERGTVTINHKTDFGNVLPGGTRRWEVDWKGERNLLEMGRYRAELVLTYGESVKQTVDQTLYFWVIYWRPLIIAFSALLVLVISVILLVRLYIRRAIVVTQQQVGLARPPMTEDKQAVSVPPQIDNPVVDLKANIKQRTSIHVDKNKSGWPILKFLLIFSLIIFMLTAGVVVYFYLQDQPSNDYSLKEEISPPQLPIEATDKAVEEEIEPATSTVISEEKPGEEESQEINKEIKIEIQNGSGRAGLARKAADKLEAEGWQISSIGNADSFRYISSKINYKDTFTSEAMEIADSLPGEFELEKISEQKADVIIILGSSYK